MTSSHFLEDNLYNFNFNFNANYNERRQWTGATFHHIASILYKLENL
jgi:hypothetical protein